MQMSREMYEQHLRDRQKACEEFARVLDKPRLDLEALVSTWDLTTT